MNSGKHSSNKELAVIPVNKNPKSITLIDRISTGVRFLFGRTPATRSDVAGTITIKKDSKPLPIPSIVVHNLENALLEDMMHHIKKKINQLPDEWTIIEVQRLFSEFGDGTKQNRVKELAFINSDIMPLIGKDETLPTMFFGHCSTIIEKFGIIVKEQLERIKQKKLAEMMNYVSLKIDQLPNDKSVVELASTINSVLGKRTEWDNQFKMEYINEILIPFIGEKGNLPKILEKDVETILEGFHTIVQQKAISILQKKRAKLVPRIGQSK